MFATYILVSAMLAPVPAPAGKPASLTPQEDASIRAAIYGQAPKTVSPNRDFKSELVVPKSVRDLYAKSPDHVLALLVRIADGAAPSDSLLAVATAIELMDGPGAGVACVLIFKPDTYDAIDEDWKCTPREHWLKYVRGALEKRQKK